MATLVLLRHGESDWNQKNLFTGWVDVDLTAKGEAEAHRGGQLLAERGLLPDVLHTSLLRRAIRTAQIALDDAAPVASPLIREVTPGKHRVRVDAAGFNPAERDVIAVAGELMFTEANLVERPSTLAVWTRRDAELYVDGTLVGSGGPGVPFQLPSGIHRLAVAEKGHRIAYRTLTLERGKGATVRVELEPTTQRTASRLLFIGGGAALGVGLVLGALAVHSENSAEDFLGRQSHRNVTASELDDYHESIRDRDLYRALSIGHFIAAGSFFITGFFLGEFDHPNLREIRSTPPAPETHIAPLLGAGTYGATLHTTF